MSAANFCTMRDFPLLARDFEQDGYRCPVCGSIHETEQEICPICGEAVEMEEEALYDDFEEEYICGEIRGLLDGWNSDLMFHKVELRGGYYTGVQFYVEVEYDLGAEDYSNNDCHYYFDCCRSVAYRKYAAEVRKINRKLAEWGRDYGFQEYVCTARFSNGEAWFEPASNPRARLKAAVD